MRIKTAALVAVPALAAGLVTWAFQSKPYALQADGCATITPAGRLRVALARQFIKLSISASVRILGFPKLGMRRIEQRVVPTAHGAAAITCYWPEATGPLPVYINFHGGGFIIGFPEQDDRLCRYLAHYGPCVVINVDYILAPKHPFPAAVLQCYEVVKWVHSHAQTLGYDASRLAVGGHSAGGGIAAAIALLACERQEFSLALQLLDYPSLNLAEPSSQKHVLPDKKQALSVKDAAFFKHLYAPCPADRRNPLASPLLAPAVTGLSPALIITAENDLLLSDGRAYADKLRQQGVPVEYHEFRGVDHAFTHFGPKEPAQQAWNLMLTSLQSAFAVAERKES
jgi:acetyl esterase